MHHRTQSSAAKGFTLVEILIVVVILGILAAIVIPQFSNASESAKASSAISTLQALRSQLELAQTQHQGTYPDLGTDGWDVLTDETNPVAAYSTTDSDDGITGNMVGPYLQQSPTNPFTGGTAVGTDWSYNNSSGDIFLIVTTDLLRASALGLTPGVDFVRPSGGGG